MPTSEAEHTALVRRFLADVISEGDTGAIDHFLAGDPRLHEPTAGGSPIGPGIDPVAMAILSAADLEVDLEHVVARDAEVAVMATLAGHLGGIPSSLGLPGDSFEIGWFAVFRIEDGNIAGIRSIPDKLALLQQLEVLPRSRGTGAAEWWLRQPDHSTHD